MKRVSHLTVTLNPLILLLIALNVFLTVWHLGKLAVSDSHGQRVDRSYSYIGSDHPLMHPNLPLRPASLTLQESVRYGSNGSDPLTAQAWNSFTRRPRGLGRAILGPEHRAFLMTFYHQLHCVGEIQRGLSNKADPEATPHHMKHCMDYLRQTFLCAATDTLEKGDFLERNFETQRTGGDLVCWDWELIYGSLDQGWADFSEWLGDHLEEVKPIAPMQT